MHATTIQLPGPNGDRDDATELFRFDFQADSLRNPHLAGGATELWQVSGPVELVQMGSFTGRRSADYLYLEARQTAAPSDLRTLAKALYAELCSVIATTGYSTPVRFWNVIPDINELADQGVPDSENYRQFCWGRAEALEGCGFALPAATGVGGHNGELYVSMLAAKPSVSIAHFENPRQVSAYDYPRQYGPRSPSFARSTRVSQGSDALLLLSGTASIVNHESLHTGDLAEQCLETRRNIAALLEAVYRHSVTEQAQGGAQVGEAGVARPQHAGERATSIASRLYLRHPEQLAAVQTSFSKAFEGSAEPTILESDICRQELLMEVEGVFRLEPSLEAS